MTATLTLLRAIDDLYAGVVTEPAAWQEQALADWAEDTAAGGVTTVQARAVRRCLRLAEKLRDFWLDPGTVVPADEWATRVDVALGIRAWRPTLELARAGLAAEPSPELFAEVQRRFRLVHSAPWMEGIGYEEWRARAAPTE